LNDIKTTFYLVVLISLISGCYTPPETSQYVPRPTTESAPTGKARIVVERDSSWGGSDCTVTIFSNESVIGIVADGDFLEWDQPLGVFELKGNMTCPVDGYNVTTGLELDLLEDKQRNLIKVYHNGGIRLEPKNIQSGLRVRKFLRPDIMNRGSSNQNLEALPSSVIGNIAAAKNQQELLSAGIQSMPAMAQDPQSRQLMQQAADLNLQIQQINEANKRMLEEKQQRLNQQAREEYERIAKTSSGEPDVGAISKILGPRPDECAVAAFWAYEYRRCTLGKNNEWKPQGEKRFGCSHKNDQGVVVGGLGCGLRDNGCWGCGID